jgi:uncharacterized coiled-coil protein SlyX
MFLLLLGALRQDAAWRIVGAQQLRTSLTMDEDPIERLEIKIAFLEHTTSELSDMVFRQQQDIVALKDRLTALSSRFDAFKSNEGTYAGEEERPPHY